MSRPDPRSQPINIFRDGALYGGTFQSYEQINRYYVVNVDGGVMTSPNAWNMSNQAEVDRVNISGIVVP